VRSGPTYRNSNVGAIQLQARPELRLNLEMLNALISYRFM